MYSILKTNETNHSMPIYWYWIWWCGMWNCFLQMLSPNYWWKTNVNITQNGGNSITYNVLCMFSVHISDKTFWEHVDDSDGHRPLHHFNIKAETLVNWVSFPPNAGLQLEHLRLVQDKTVLKITHHALINIKLN